MNGFHILIPARLDSTRLPEKALADIAGLPLIVRVWQRAMKAGALSVRVVTDSGRIAAAVGQAGGEVVMTGAEHRSGTSRLAEAVDRLGLADEALVINVQGDEPAVPVACIRQLAKLLGRHCDAEMATLWVPITEPDQWRDRNVVKLVAAADGRALYFSRAPIPARVGEGWPSGLARRHVGLYAYRVAALKNWSKLPGSELERNESLEQLRALEAGWTIACEAAVEDIPPGVDTPADLEEMRRYFA